MAWTITVARHGQQQIRVTNFHALKVAAGAFPDRPMQLRLKG